MKQLTFVGPPAAAIAAMGSKIVAKNRMREAGVTIDARDLEPLLQQGAARDHEASVPVAFAPDPGTTAVADGGSLKDIAKNATEAAEKQAIVEALRVTGGNKQKAAQRLQTDYKTLFVKLKRYGLGNARQPAAE